jgi:peptidoglycan/LPS O-acetylase OafA/YrhL
MVQQVRDLVERTPPRRVRHVDLLRAVAIVAVVVGPRGFSALQQLTGAHPLTCLSRPCRYFSSWGLC